jgi:Fe-S-cluster-containing hydrogenase component 2
MPKKSNKRERSTADIFQILTKETDKQKKKRREELLAPLDVEEFFVEGSIDINKKTCDGVECKLCIEACPTNALYWRLGEVGIIEELCIYCGACVLSCIVDDCIKIVRKRPDGEVEMFSKPKDFESLQHRINTKKRFGKVQEVFPQPEDYLKRKRSTKKKRKKKEKTKKR